MLQELNTASAGARDRGKYCTFNNHTLTDSIKPSVKVLLLYFDLVALEGGWIDFY